ncbi:hypothetical protein DYQ94_11605 [Xanthomonas sp. LMG 8993]|nr:hypothetical protein [Xanthomonas sp. LMG 8993]
MGNRDSGFGIRDSGLAGRVSRQLFAVGPGWSKRQLLRIPNPESPIPNSQSPELTAPTPASSRYRC